MPSFLGPANSHSVDFFIVFIPRLYVSHVRAMTDAKFEWRMRRVLAKIEKEKHEAAESAAAAQRMAAKAAADKRMADLVAAGYHPSGRGFITWRTFEAACAMFLVVLGIMWGTVLRVRWEFGVPWGVIWWDAGKLLFTVSCVCTLCPVYAFFLYAGMQF